MGINLLIKDIRKTRKINKFAKIDFNKITLILIKSQEKFLKMEFYNKNLKLPNLRIIKNN